MVYINKTYHINMKMHEELTLSSHTMPFMFMADFSFLQQYSPLTHRPFDMSHVKSHCCTAGLFLIRHTCTVSVAEG